MTASINGTTGVTFPDASVQGTAATGFGFKNRIINGAMMIDQRNAGASVTLSSGGIYTLDRFQILGSQSSKVSVQQNAGSVTPPAGFSNYLGVTSLSAYSILSSDYFLLGQPIEGYNTADLDFGASNASSVTLSFWVRSSLTGTFGGSLQNSNSTRCYPFTYTINAANTWEQKKITISGDTTGTWLKTNGIGLWAWFGLGVGSSFSGTPNAWGTSGFSATGATSVVGTSGATFYITGVQLEKGSTATSFDYRPYGTELALCQRYAWKCNQYYGYSTDGANSSFRAIAYPVQMRAAPTIEAGSSFIVSTGSAGTPALYTTTAIPTSPNLQYVYNSANNWSTPTSIQINCVFGAEL